MARKPEFSLRCASTMTGSRAKPGDPFHHQPKDLKATFNQIQEDLTALLPSVTFKEVTVFVMRFQTSQHCETKTPHRRCSANRVIERGSSSPPAPAPGDQLHRPAPQTDLAQETSSTDQLLRNHYYHPHGNQLPTVISPMSKPVVNIDLPQMSD